MFKKNKKKWTFWGIGVIIAAIAWLVCYTQVLYSVDKMLSDKVYQSSNESEQNIKILAIDERTIQKYGDIKTWDREIWARLVEKLNENAIDPAVIALDIMFVSDVEGESDAYFAKVCAEGGNVVTASNIVYADEVNRSADGSLVVEKQNVKFVEYPYDALKEVTAYGFANTLQDVDGYIRYAKTQITYEKEQMDSFAAAVYRKYCENQGIDFILPKTMDDGVFSFAYSGKSGTYEIISLCDVLDGLVDTQVFADSIVMAGAYAPGMQDAYNVPVQKGVQMYGVEIQANIVEAILEGKTQISVDLMIYSTLIALIIVSFYLISDRAKITTTSLVMAGMIIVDILGGWMLYQQGIVISMIELPIFVLLIYVYQLIRRYLLEILRRKKIISAFKKYVAPQVVEELSKKGNFQIELGGENRHIAVLFVDIRGFTPMSENLKPEEVVGILNEYLSLTTNSIFHNGGTLDKFIGDATMAIFNAPFDQADYIYKAVCTARDIAFGSAALEKRLQERFGRSISFGIGINCGNAVVGNIGCEYRMDYTAIGDTVNTAARLESNAKPGQILISQEVYEAVKDRVKVTEIGEIPLKGKSKGVFVYQVDQVL